MTSGFCKGTVPGAPPLPSPGPLRMLKKNPKEMYLVPPEGHILVKNLWSDFQIVQRHRARCTPLPIHKAPRMPKDSSKKRAWYQARRHVCAKARLRNPEQRLTSGSLLKLCCLRWRTLMRSELSANKLICRWRWPRETPLGERQTARQREGEIERERERNRERQQKKEKTGRERERERDTDTHTHTQKKKNT